MIQWSVDNLKGIGKIVKETELAKLKNRHDLFDDQFGGFIKNRPPKVKKFREEKGGKQSWKNKEKR